MIVIKQNIIPFGKKYYAINLFGIIFAKGDCTRRTLNHESIHTAQIKELGYIFFYILYVMEWLVRIIIHRNCFSAYRNISFEKEAYDNDADMQYLKSRKHYAFFKYLK